MIDEIELFDYKSRMNAANKYSVVDCSLPRGCDKCIHDFLIEYKICPRGTSSAVYVDSSG